MRDISLTLRQSHVSDVNPKDVCKIEPSHKPHNALDIYPTMHHFFKKKCAHMLQFLFQNGALWDTGLVHCSMHITYLSWNVTCANYHRQTMQLTIHRSGNLSILRHNILFWVSSHLGFLADIYPNFSTYNLSEETIQTAVTNLLNRRATNWTDWIEN